MPLRKARSIDDLYEQAAGFDLVLTSDAPLALSLNRRTDEPRLGTFAATPMNWAQRGLDLPDQRELFHRVLRDTRLGFKPAATLLDLALRCWEETGDRTSILDWRRYDTPGMRDVLDVLADEPSGHRARAETAVPDELDIAVVGAQALSGLDRRLVPEDATVIELFEPGETFGLPPFQVLPSTHEIVATLDAALTPENAPDVGIVLDPTGPLRPLVESLLDARSIPYHTDEGLTDDAGLRAFLRALRLGLGGHRLRGRDVRGLLAHLGWPARSRDDGKRLAELDGPGHRRLRALFDELGELTLGEAAERFDGLHPRVLTDLHDLLSELGLTDVPVDAAPLNALAFYLDTFEIQRDRRREGVLLASATANATVDRPLVFHLGMDADWTEPIPEYPWIDRQRREQRNAARFERLIQSGDPPVYLVQDARGGEPVTPCFHLHELLDQDFRRFTDLPHERATAPEPHDAAQTRPGVGFDRVPVDVEVPTVHTLSASTLDRLETCPRDVYMAKLVRDVDRRAFERGHLFHEFAELYAAHPDAVDVSDPDQLADVLEKMLDELAPFLDPDEEPALRTRLAVGLVNIAHWLDANPPRPLDGLTGYEDPPADRQGPPNRFAEHLGIELDTTRTERWFNDPDVGLHGKIDLLHGPDRLVDWKTTRSPPSQRRTVRRALVDSDEDEPAFQPAAYLAHHRTVAPDRGLAFTFVDLLSNERDVVRGDDALDDVERTVPYRPIPFQAWIATREAYESLLDSKNREDVLGAIGYDAYRRFFQARDELPAFTSKRAIVETELCEAFIELGIRERGDLKKTRKACRSALKQLVAHRGRMLFAEDLDTFTDHVATRLEDLDRWRRTRFPIGEGADASRYPDLILERLGPDPEEVDP